MPENEQKKGKRRTAYIGFVVEPETHDRVSGLAKVTGLSRSEFMRRAIDVAENHLGEIRAQGEPDHPKSRWHH